MSQTIHFGSNTTEFPLEAAPIVPGNYTNISITPSSTVTSEAVYTAVNGAD